MPRAIGTLLSPCPKQLYDLDGWGAVSHREGGLRENVHCAATFIAHSGRPTGDLHHLPDDFVPELAGHSVVRLFVIAD